MNKNFPFLYFGHGAWIAKEGQLKCYILFEEAPSQKDLKAIQRGLPRPLRDYTVSFDKLLCVGSPKESYKTGKRIGEIVKRLYSKKSTKPESGLKIKNLTKEDKKEMDDGDELSWEISRDNYEYGDRGPWTAFYKELDAWLLKTHSQFPISVFVRPAIVRKIDKLSEWHWWSIKNLLQAVEELDKVPQRKKPVETGYEQGRFIYELGTYAIEKSIPKPSGKVLLSLMERNKPWNHIEEHIKSSVIKRIKSSVLGNQ
jgi:hypothetical protein